MKSLIKILLLFSVIGVMIAASVYWVSLGTYGVHYTDNVYKQLLPDSAKVVLKSYRKYPINGENCSGAYDGNKTYYIRTLYNIQRMRNNFPFYKNIATDSTNYLVGKVE